MFNVDSNMLVAYRFRDIIQVTPIVYLGAKHRFAPNLIATPITNRPDDLILLAAHGRERGHCANDHTSGSGMKFAIRRTDTGDEFFAVRPWPLHNLDTPPSAYTFSVSNCVS